MTESLYAWSWDYLYLLVQTHLTLLTHLWPSELKHSWNNFPGHSVNIEVKVPHPSSLGYPYLRIYNPVYPHLDIYPPKFSGTTSATLQLETVSVQVPTAYPNFNLYPAMYPYNLESIFPRTFRLAEDPRNAATVKNSSTADCAPNHSGNPSLQLDIYPIFNLYPAVYPHFDIYPAAATVASCEQQNVGQPEEPLVGRIPLGSPGSFTICQYPDLNIYPALGC